MGFLDQFNDPNFINSLLGINSQTAVQTNGGEGSPLSANDLNYGNNSSVLPQQPGPTDSILPKQDMLGSANFLPNQTAARGNGLSVGQPQAQAAALAPPAQAAPQAQTMAPMPPADPRTANAAALPNLAPAMPPVDPRTSDLATQAPAAPDTRSVPVPSAVNAGQSANAQGGNDGLFSQITGLQPAKPSTFQQAMAGLGKGLSAVGGLRPGASAGQAFAAGAGGALSGGYAAGQKENDEFFKNTIAASNQYMKFGKYPHDLAHEDAGTNYLNSGVQQRLNNAALGPMGKVYGSWLQSDIGRMKLADAAFDSEEKRNIQYLQEKNKAGIDVSADWKKMEEARDQRKADVYKRYGINDPVNYKGSEKNPIDGSTLTPQQLEHMPEGTHYKDKSGRLLRRDYTVWPNQAALALTNGGNAGDYATTQAAMSAGGQQPY